VSELEQPSRRRRAPRRRRWPRRLLAVLAAVVLLAVGVALGQALDDGPEPGVTQTSVRTLEPLPQQPATTTP
jgi:hypothetical protein